MGRFPYPLSYSIICAAHNKKKSHYQEKLLRCFIETLRCLLKSPNYQLSIVNYQLKNRVFSYLCGVINMIGMETRYAKTLTGGGKYLIISKLTSIYAYFKPISLFFKACAVTACALFFCGCTKDYEPQPPTSIGVRSTSDSTATSGSSLIVDTTWDEPVNTEF